MIGNVVFFLIGFLFAVGFALAGVTDPGVIVGFLDFTGDWNPGVLLVMAAAITVTGVSYRLMFRTRQKPVLAPRFGVPTRRDIDGRLVAGAAVFGAGWGLVGLCPGPAFTGLGVAGLPVVVFLGTMLGGMGLFKVWDGYMKRRPVAAKASVSAAAPAAR